MTSHRISQALWRVYNRPPHPTPFAFGGNLPYDDPDFSRRMLALHLAEDDGAASRVSAERILQLPWFIDKLNLKAGDHLLDLTCGPGLYAVPLAQMGIRVTGIDFAPAAVEHAQQLAEQSGVSDLCTFIQADVKQINNYVVGQFDAAVLLYGQLAVMMRDEAAALLQNIQNLLQDEGRVCLEMLDQKRVDKQNSSWWFSDDKGLWGDSPFLHLGERQWRPDTNTSLERYHIIHLESGEMDEIILCDQTYSVDEMCEMMRRVGFGRVDLYPAWDGLPLYDAAEWVVYVAHR